MFRIFNYRLVISTAFISIFSLQAKAQQLTDLSFYCTDFKNGEITAIDAKVPNTNEFQGSINSFVSKNGVEFKALDINGVPGGKGTLDFYNTTVLQCKRLGYPYLQAYYQQQFLPVNAGAGVIGVKTWDKGYGQLTADKNTFLFNGVSTQNLNYIMIFDGNEDKGNLRFIPLNKKDGQAFEKEITAEKKVILNDIEGSSGTLDVQSVVLSEGKPSLERFTFVEKY